MANTNPATTVPSLIVSAELMPNQVAGHRLPQQRHLAVTASVNQRPMLFAVDATGQFNLTLEAKDSPTGWSQVNLTPQLANLSGLGASPVVQSFTTSQDDDGGIWIVLAAGTTLGSPSQVFLSSKLPNTGLATDWNDLASHLVSRPVPADIVVSGFLLGRDDDKLGAPLIAAVGAPRDNKAVHYMINPDATDKTWDYLPLGAAQNATSVIDAAVGSIADLGRGVYTLSAINDTKTLTFTTLPETFGGHPVTESRQLGLPKDFQPSTMTSVTVRKGHTELFVGGSGVCHFSEALQADSNLVAVSIADAKAIPNVSTLTVNTDSAATTMDIWALDYADQLVHLEGSKHGDNYTWLSPLIVHSEVTAMAAYRMTDAGSSVDAAGLLLGKANGPLTLLTQDSTTSLWQPNTVALLETSDCLTINTYTTHVTLRDKDGVPWGSQAVTIQPSHDCSAIVNGQSMALKQSVAKTAMTDADGVVSIVLETADLSAPVLALKSNGLSRMFDPTNLMNKTLHGHDEKGITAAEIARAQRSDDKPLFPHGADTKKCEAAAELVAKLVQVQNDLPNDGSVHVASVKPHLLAFSEPHRQIVTAMGVRFTGDKPEVLQHEEALAAHTAYAGTENLWVTAGDLFMAIARSLDRITHVFVNRLQKGWAFVVELGGKLVQFLFDTAAQVSSAFNYVLQKTLDLVMNDLVAWLGFVFGWEDILLNQKVLANVFNIGLDQTVNSVAATKSTIVDAFASVRNMITSNKLLLDKSNALFNDKARSEPKADDPASESPQSQWAGQQMKNYASEVKQSSVSLGDINDLFNDLGDTQLQVMKNAISSIQGTLVDGFDEMTWGEIMMTIFEVVGVTLLDSAQGCVLSLLDATTILVRIFKAILNARLEIPVLTYVFEKIICQDDGTKFTMLNAITLCAAIPATIMFKLISGENMFSAEQVKQLTAAPDWDSVMSGLHIPPANHHPSRRVATLSVSRHLGGPHATFATTWHSPAMRSAVVFGCVSATARIVSTVCFPLIQLFDVPGEAAWLSRALRDVFDRIKVGCEWAIYVFNSVAMSCTLAVSRNPNSARSVIDSTLSTATLLFRIKDTYVAIYRAKNRTASPPMAPALNVVQSVMGVAMLVSVCVSVAMQTQEAVPNGVPAPQWAGIITTKFVANCADGLQTSLSFAALTEGQIKVAAKVVRSLLVLIQGLSTLARAGLETSIAYAG